MKNNKGLSQVISIVVIVVLVLIAMAVIWGFAGNLIRENVEDTKIIQESIGIELKPLKAECDNIICNITITRNSKSGNVAGVKVVLFDESKLSNEIKTIENKIQPLQTTIIEVPIGEMKNISKISVYPYFMNSQGDEVISDNKKEIILNSDEEEIIQDTFVCGEGSVTDADGNTYGTVLINGQCWMDSNMRTTKYPDGTEIEKGPSEHGASEWGSDNGYYSCPPNEANNGEDCGSANKLGMLYQWSAVMHGSITEGVQGLCPEGWHVPSDSEWYALEDYLKAEGNVCDASRINSAYEWECNHAGCNLAGYEETWKDGQLDGHSWPSLFNTTGFQAPSSGYRRGNGDYFGRTIWLRIWTSTQNPDSTILIRSFYYGNTGIGRFTYGTQSGLPVRCIKD